MTVLLKPEGYFNLSLRQAIDAFGQLLSFIYGLLLVYTEECVECVI